MNQIEVFNSPEFGSIRVIEENGKYLFCGADVAKSLGYKDTVNALKTHCREDGVAFYHLTDNLGRKQKAKFISEGNLYRLIVHSKLPSAERFEKWVFDEVLPTIRKHGSYLTKEKLWEVATSPEALLKLCSDLLAEREENVSLRIANAQLEGIYGYECKRHHDTPRIRLQNEQGNPTPICEIKPVGQSKLELMASQIFERVWGDQREIVLQTCKMLDACYKPDADRRADLMKAKDDSVQLLQQQLDDLVVVRARGEIEQDKFLQRTIEIQQQMEALRQSKAQIASEDYNPGRLDMEAIEAALCEAVEMHDGLVSEDFIDLFVSQVTPLSDSRFAWCLDFSPQPTVAFLNLAGQRKYTTCSMDSKLHFGPFADEEGHTIPFPGSLRR